MRLQSIYIKEYKQLKEFRIDFKNVERSIGQDPFRFLIGRNGVGKSSLLEAIGLIFTRMLQDETPGFAFEVVYTMDVDGRPVTIAARPNDGSDSADLESRLQVDFTNVEGKKTRLNLRKQPFSQYREYHPRRIIGYASGPTNGFEDILLTSPVESIKSDIYDARHGAQEEQDYDLSLLEIEQSLVNLQRLYDDASYLYIDGKTSALVLLCLCAAIPSINSDTESRFDHTYIALRKKLFDMIGGIVPIGMTFVVDEMRLKEYVETKPRSMRLQPLVRWMSTQSEQSDDQSVSHAWCISRQKETLSDHQLTTTTHKERVAYFPITELEQGAYHCFGLGLDTHPFELLTMLLIAKREGLLLDAHLVFKHKQSNRLLYEKALSDGEYFWLGRLGLVLLARSASGDTLFLFDEPDIHLNESWNEQFVELLHQLSVTPDGTTRDEFIIATHSTLLLTDVDPDQLYLLERTKEKETRVVSLAISTFAANRVDISKRIFGVTSPIGQYSRRLVTEKFSSDNKDQLIELAKKVGPGYYRFRIHSQLEQFEHQQRGGDDNLTPDEQE
ncbi:AAA family ATPase [Paenibacillus sp. 7124]|uniref:AAA family ATPase n=1 Tax=Paenibacillus apii TaxID=1850370 RepID=A0A6M1PK22_9BACL|nr:AAA family ATPase [Paenibacillus apii]NGM83947.1 AAA family ATPase [Paenibacillus apii]